MKSEERIALPVSDIAEHKSHGHKCGKHLVTQEEFECRDFQVLGLITAHDIERELPRRSPRTTDFRVRKQVRVADVMTPWNELSLVKYESLQALTALDLYDMFQGTGLTHLLVIDIYGDDAAVARGLLSRATLARRLRHAHNIAPAGVNLDGVTRA